MDEKCKAALEALVDHLRRDGLPARMGAEEAYLGIGDVAVVIPWSQFQANAAGTMHSANLVVAVRIYEGKPCLFEDVVAGLGTTVEDAARRTLLAWRHGVLPTILPLLGQPTPADVEIIQVGHELYCPPWVMHAGPLQYSGPHPEPLLADLRDRPPLLELRELLASAVDPKQMHWLKMFRCRDRSLDLDLADCLLDGQPFAAGQERLKAWSWPDIDGRHLFRQFIVMLPEDRY